MMTYTNNLQLHYYEIDIALDDLPIKQNRFPSLNAFWHYSLLTSLLVLMGCSNQTNEHLQKETVKTTNLSNGVVQESLSPPKIISITLSNLPKVVKAGKPIIKVDSSNGGVPCNLRGLYTMARPDIRPH